MLNEDDDDLPQPPPLPSQETVNRPRGLGCFLKGCLTTVTVLMFIGVGIGAFGWFFVKSGQTYIGDQPAPIQVAEPSDAQYENLLSRLQPFREAMDAGRAATVEISADDLNALIARVPQLVPLRGEVFVAILHGQIIADLSWPGTCRPPGTVFYQRPRHARCLVRQREVYLCAAAGGPAPRRCQRGLLPWMLRRPEFLQGYSQMINHDFNNFAHGLAGQDPVVADVLAKLRTAVIQNDHIILTTVERPDPAAPTPAAGATPD